VVKRFPIVEGGQASRPIQALAQFSFSNTGSLIYIPGPVFNLVGRSRVSPLVDRKGRWSSRLEAPARCVRAPPASLQTATRHRVCDRRWEGRETCGPTICRAPRRAARADVSGARTGFRIWSAGRRACGVPVGSGRRSRYLLAACRRHRPAGAPHEAGSGKPPMRPEVVVAGWKSDSCFRHRQELPALSLWTFSIAGQESCGPLGTCDRSIPIQLMRSFSPDGRWVAYRAYETAGKWRDFLCKPFSSDWRPPSTRSRRERAISRAGPPDGKELFYIQRGGRIRRRQRDQRSQRSPSEIPCGCRDED